MLIENTLLGTVNKPEIAIKRLQEFERFAIAKDERGYHVAFSGGKDSIVLLDLVRKSGVKHYTHFNVTTVDPPELLRFIRDNYQDVKWEYPEMNMFQLIRHEQMPPTRFARFCCRKLKERTDLYSNRIVVTGVRWEESIRRSKRGMLETCFKNKTLQYLHPIIDWTEQDVWQYIHEQQLPYCTLYDQGWKRIGCVGCPMSPRKQRQEHLDRYPSIKRAYYKAFEAVIKSRKEDGTLRENWSRAEDIMNWYLEIEEPQTDEEMPLFE